MPTALKLFDGHKSAPNDGKPGRRAVGPSGRERREFPPEPETWTRRMIRSLSRMHTAEVRVPKAGRDRQLIDRLLAAVWYLHQREKRAARAKLRARQVNPRRAG